MTGRFTDSRFTSYVETYYKKFIPTPFTVKSVEELLTCSNNSNRTNCGDKQATQYLNANMETLHVPLRAKGYLLTCDYSPDYYNVACWNNITDHTKAIIDYLQSRPDFVYAVSTVETHVPRIRTKKATDTDTDEETKDCSKPLPQPKPKGKRGRPKGVTKAVIAARAKASTMPTLTLSTPTLTLSTPTPLSTPLTTHLVDISLPSPTVEVGQVPPKSTVIPIIHQCDTLDEIYKEVYSFFTERDYTHEINTATSINEVLYRLLKYYIYDRLAAHFYEKVELNTQSLEYFLTNINNLLVGKNLSQDFPHSTICTNVYNAIATLGTIPKGDKTLAGYPHLHMAIFLNSSTPITELARQIMFLRSKIPNFFIDIDVGGKTRGSKMKRSLDTIDPQNDARIIGYTIKNCRYANNIKRLGRYPLQLHSSNPQIIEFYQYLLFSSGIVFNGLEAKTQEEALVMPRYVPPVIGVTTKSILDIPSSDVTTSDPSFLRPATKDKKALTHKIVNTFMIRKNLAVLYVPPEHPYYSVDGFRDIYAKHPDTKNTWYLWGKGTRVLEEIFATDEGMENLSTLLTNQSEIDSLLKYSTLVPTIHIDFMWIELRDCFFHIQSNYFTDSSHGRPCHKHDYDFGKEELLKITSGELIPEFTFNLLKYQKILDVDNLPKGIYDRNHPLHVMYNIYRPRKLKDPQLALIGPTNCGKTTLLDALMSLFSEDRVGVLANSAHNLEVILDKRAIHLKEFERGILTSSDFKSLTEGGSTIAINPKHKTPIQYRVNMPVVISSNTDSWAMIKKDQYSINPDDIFSSRSNEVIMDPAIKTRICFAYFNTINCIDLGAKLAIMKEAMLFFFHLVKFASGGKPFEYVDEKQMKMALEYFDRKNKMEGYDNPFKC
jgi:hypothetical protein